MFCVECGNELEEGAQSCPLCNAKVEDETIHSEDVKDFAVEYSAILKEKSVKLMETAQENVKRTQEKMEEKRMLNIQKQQEKAGAMMFPQNAMANQQGGARIRCPRCQNENLQIITETGTTGKDFSAGKSCCGYILLGPIGLLCGMCGKGKQTKTTIYWICPMCGNKFKA